MRLRYDADLLEAVVFLHAGGPRCAVPAPGARRFHREREALYGIANPDEREDAFFRLNAGWFRQWGFERRLLDLVAEFPLISQSLGLLAFRKAAGRHDEGAELFVKPASRNAVVALQPARLAAAATLPAFLRHEFTHLHDMLDPAFGYLPDLRVPNPNQLRLARDRYRLLWDVTIDGRLANAGHTTPTARAQHEAAFDHAFGFWDEPARRAAFESLWCSPRPRHADLARTATDPRCLARSRQPLPGALCPLCGFPTFAWSDGDALCAATRARLTTEFPDWCAAEGLCNRCAEVLEAGAVRCAA